MFKGYVRDNKELTKPETNGQVVLDDAIFCCGPEQLRAIAQFLTIAAGWLEEPLARTTDWHAHARLEVQGWDNLFPNEDVIVCLPE